MNIQLQQQITPELSLYAYNDIPVLHLHHAAKLVTAVTAAATGLLAGALIAFGGGRK